MFSTKQISTFFLSLFLLADVAAQLNNDHPTGHVTVVADKQYQKSKFGRWLWGSNWREEWLTPVRVPVVWLDTVYGGLSPYEAGGGGESKSLRLRSADGKRYALRSIAKNRSGGVPGLLKNTFFNSLVQDGVSMSNPYAALTIPPMLQQAGIPHTRPMLVYMPRQPALDTFNGLFADDIYLLEEKPEGSWSDAAHLGGYKKYNSTLQVKEKLRDDNRHKADQPSFIKARLFDILISDVDRHGGNWAWGVADTGTLRYKPVPLDRDQAFFTHNGLLTKASIALARRRFLQSFGYRIKNVKSLTSYDRKLDKFFANEMNYAHWQNAATVLRQSLTDSVLAQSIQQLPPEIFALSGPQIIEKLKQRRDDLEGYAAWYYYTVARKVEVNGTAQGEHFEVRKLANGQTTVSVYRLHSGHQEDIPYYQRTFTSKETKRVTLFGFGGADTFDIDKNINRIKVVLKRGINKAQFAGKGGTAVE
jgi:hypothetical protein